MVYCTIVVALLIIGLLIWALGEVRKAREADDLKNMVAWIVSPKDDIRWNIPLWAHIKDAQLHCNISDKYRISWDLEKDYVNDIICVFRDNLVDQFFCGAITYKKINELILPKQTAKYTDFFLFRLFCFLAEHHTDSNLFGHDMYKRQISYENHGMWGRPLYDATYELSDFGRTVQKLYYIAFLACKESIIYKDEIAGWITPEYFTEDLDANQVRISSR